MLENTKYKNVWTFLGSFDFLILLGLVGLITIEIIKLFVKSC